MFFRFVFIFEKSLFDNSILIFVLRNLFFFSMFLRKLKKLNYVCKSSNKTLSKFDRLKSLFHFFVVDFF